MIDTSQLSDDRPCLVMLPQEWRGIRYDGQVEAQAALDDFTSQGRTAVLYKWHHMKNRFVRLEDWTLDTYSGPSCQTG